MADHLSSLGKTPAFANHVRKESFVALGAGIRDELHRRRRWTIVALLPLPARTMEGKGVGRTSSTVLREISSVMALSSSLPRLLRKPSSSSQILQRMKLLAAGDPSRPFTTCEGSRPTIIHKRSLDILHDPWFNKGTAFSMTERDRLDLRGLLPPNHMTPQQKIEPFNWKELQSVEDKRCDKRSSLLGPFLETLSFAIPSGESNKESREEGKGRELLLVSDTRLEAQAAETTGKSSRDQSLGREAACGAGTGEGATGRIANASHTPGRTELGGSGSPRISEKACADTDRGSEESCWPVVDMIVVTDGSRLLGLGDLGVQGIGITIGKLDLYVAAAGINPQRVLPVMIDVGTNNEKLLHDPLYLGLQEHRLDGEDYISVIDEFMEAVFTRWPHVIVQFEDFQSKWAFKLLQRYRNNYRMFNDDV
ncbi:hypothetical protein ZIOFF_010237 [Zingiber officinale]|uniref:Malic enzyme N-terminal domain-containing protein n=1 Tax=Zingiber officinale TaxID=94328 RepID=A0A8J5HIX3_ZINOF|nr:hypothetical protein ZIOFF_010237 [Zingiber officinale]